MTIQFELNGNNLNNSIKLMKNFEILQTLNQMGP